MNGKQAILKCSCAHEFQDKTYGKDMRVHNQAKGGSQGTVVVRCTVCGNQKTIANAETQGGK